MARCPSPQEILTASILRQKWIDRVVARLFEAYELIESGRNFETVLRTLQADLAAMITPESQKQSHFKSRGSQLRAFTEATTTFLATPLDDRDLQSRLAAAATPPAP